MSVIAASLERLKVVSMEGRLASRPPDLHLWDGLDSAIAVTEKYILSLEILGESGLRSAMRVWLTPAAIDVKSALIRSATMTELTEGSAPRDAWELDQDSERRAQVKRELVEWLTDLGVVGVRLLLAVAFV